jgi:hypothetical protein
MADELNSLFCPHSSFIICTNVIICLKIACKKGKTISPFDIIKYVK